MNPHETWIVAGSRTFKDYELLSEILAFICPAEIISGGAEGADTLAKDYALTEGIEYTEVLADWERHGKSAGPIRNRKMAEMCPRLIVFWDNKSLGTYNMLATHRELHKTNFERIIVEI